MGAMGAGPFDSDGALDWVADYADDGVIMVRNAFQEALESDEFLDADLGEAAVAAAAVVARARGWNGLDYWPEGVDAHSDAIRTQNDLTELAIRVLKRVLCPETSEIAELWSDEGGEDEAEFVRVNTELTKALAA